MYGRKNASCPSRNRYLRGQNGRFFVRISSPGERNFAKSEGKTVYLGETKKIPAFRKQISVRFVGVLASKTISVGTGVENF